jgi:LPS O-antigen subunit length determinant protein (WzzB/FepE family)
MKTLSAIILLLVASIAFSSETEEDRVYSVFESTIDARFDLNFQLLADKLDSQSLSSFRKQTTIAYEKLIEEHDIDIVHNVIGIKTSPRNSTLSDKELFITLSNRAKDLDSRFIGSSDHLPVTILGTVFADGDRAVVVYEYSTSRSSRSEKVNLKAVRNLTFRKINDHWFLHSVPFARSIPQVWSLEILKHEYKIGSDEQDAAPNR